MPYAVGRIGLPQIDLFASALNHKLPTWFNRSHCQSATCIRRTQQDLERHAGVRVLLLLLFLHTLWKLCADRVEWAFVISPYWPLGISFL